MKSAWVDLLDPTPDEIEPYVANVHPMVRYRVSAPADDTPRPRIERHGNYLFGVLAAPAPQPDGEMGFQEVLVLIDADHLVTIRKSVPGADPTAHSYTFDTARDTAIANGDRLTPGFALYIVVNELAESFLDLIDELDDRIDELEDAVDQQADAHVRGEISRIRHVLLQTRRVVAPTRDVARAILDGRLELEGHQGHELLFPRDIEIRFADAYDKLLHATDGIDLSRDLLSGVRDYHQSQIDYSQNEVTKRLTVIASILLVPTFIVGMYGQNFDHMPELHWYYGYAFSWLLIVLLTVAQLWYFRRKRWF